MQLRIEKQVLLDGVQRIQNVVDKKNTIPVLSNLAVITDATTGTVILRATNLEVGMSTTLSALEVDGGSVTIPAQKLFEILRELPDATVTLTTDDKHWITVECLKARFKLSGLPLTDFPNLPPLSDHPTLTVPQPILRDMISKVLFAVSHDESRYALTGVLVVGRANELSLVATDGHRLAYVTRQIDFAGELPANVIIPLKAMTEVKKLCGNDGDIRVFLTEHQIGFQNESSLLISRLIEGQYPDYAQVIPNDSQHHIMVDHEELARALRRVALLASDTHMAKFLFQSQALTLSAQDPNHGEAQETIPIEYSGEQVLIGFNARYIMDVLAVMSGTTVNVRLNDPLAPGVFTADDDAHFLCLIMPMRI